MKPNARKGCEAGTEDERETSDRKGGMRGGEFRKVSRKGTLLRFGFYGIDRGEGVQFAAADCGGQAKVLVENAAAAVLPLPASLVPVARARVCSPGCNRANGAPSRTTNTP